VWVLLFLLFLPATGPGPGAGDLRPRPGSDILDFCTTQTVTMSRILSLCEQMPETTFRTGEVLLRENERGKTLYVLIAGEVEVLKGDVQVSSTSQPGSIFGQISALLDIPHTATVRAVENCRAYVLDDGSEFLEQNPELALDLARLVARRLQHVTTYLADLKKQFEDHTDHLGMVDEVLESLVHDQSTAPACEPGSDREYEPNI
jgi:CRP/FNR family cyclic AMP-dependent transcriptional regulator